MGLKLIANDAIAPWNTKVVPPVTRGLEAWFTFDTDASRFTFNRAIGKADAEMVGAPVAYPTHGRFKGLTNYLKTKVPDSDELTIITVGRAVVEPTDTADGVMLVSNYIGNAATPGYTGNSYGASVYAVSSRMVAAATRDNAAGGQTSSPVTDTSDFATNWAIRALRAKSGEFNQNLNFTKNSAFNGANNRGRVLADTLFRIGSATTGYAGEVDISAVAIYSVALTDDELAQVAALMRRRMARLNIAV